MHSVFRLTYGHFLKDFIEYILEAINASRFSWGKSWQKIDIVNGMCCMATFNFAFKGLQKVGNLRKAESYITWLV